MKDSWGYRLALQGMLMESWRNEFYFKDTLKKHLLQKTLKGYNVPTMTEV